jgi:hypothetical protein
MNGRDTDLVAWDADTSFPGMTDAFDRILELLQSISDSMSDEQDEPVEAVIEQHTALRREQQRFEVRRRSRRLQVELEKSLPADVPLHKRGFGVMDEDGS